MKSDEQLELTTMQLNKLRYRVFHRFGQAKFPDGGLVLGSSQFSLLPQMTPKIILDSRAVKVGPKIIISLC
jgi:hypothetical protein